MHAAKSGASSVTFVDSSSTEIENAKSNYELNDLKCVNEFVASDVFQYFNKSIEENKKFDVVMIDPPAFAKSKKDIPTAKKGYEKLNRLALNIIEDGGYLVTSSCSHHIKRDDFIEIINNSTMKTGKKIQLILFNSASLDHPQIPSMPETVYLKFAVFAVRNF